MTDSFSFLELQLLDPSLFVFLPYSTSDNFIKHKVYPTGSKAYLRKPVAEALIAAHQELKKQGYAIKVWDAYRPFHIQELLWKAFPDERYVAKPVREGQSLLQGSVHNRGAAVDLTLVTLQGEELEMPTPFDEFTERAHRNFKNTSEKAIIHRTLLEETLQKKGFIGLPTEWWHFDWKEAMKYPLTDVSIVDLGQ
jgi:D-alanyl-D-alanine dipeptidase